MCPFPRVDSRGPFRNHVVHTHRISSKASEAVKPSWSSLNLHPMLVAVLSKHHSGVLLMSYAVHGTASWKSLYQNANSGQAGTACLERWGTLKCMHYSHSSGPCKGEKSLWKCWFTASHRAMDGFIWEQCPLVLKDKGIKLRWGVTSHFNVSAGDADKFQKLEKERKMELAERRVSEWLHSVDGDRTFSREYYWTLQGGQNNNLNACFVNLTN